MSLTLASQTIGFISFGITLLTLLGVYSDLLRTLRSAPTTIPLALGNLREEIQYEQFYLRNKLRCGDEFHVFPDYRSKQRRQNREFISLVEQTLRHVWREFCNIERPFLIKGETPWSLYGDDDKEVGQEIEEKSSGSRRRKSRRRPPRRESFIKSRMGVVEASLSSDRGTYYNTDFAHRFLWWWKADDIKNIAEQIQRIQIRRIERDMYEVDELVRRTYKKHCGMYGWSLYGSDSSDESDGARSSDSRDGGGPRSGTSRRRQSTLAAGRKRRSRQTRDGDSLSRNVREVSEREYVRRPARDVGGSSSDDPRPRPKADQPRRGSVIYEYEVVDPGRIHVEYEAPRRDSNWQQGRQRSYDRERE